MLLRALILLATLCFGIVHAEPHTPAVSFPNRTAIFVSDLHMGVGRDPENTARWHNTEDFRWHKEFEDFLSWAATAGENRADLVLLGDVLELWQDLSPSTCKHTNLGQDYGCSADEALKRARRVTEQHAPVFRALGAFADQGDNRVTIVAGNHDAALAFPSVRNLVVSATRSKHGRISVETRGYWRSPDGKIVAEHGQQMGNDPNRFIGWPDAPFIERDGTLFLRQPWGENFVQSVFNGFEERYPTIDNLSSESAGLSFAVRHMGVAATLSKAGQFARFLVFQQSWGQLKQFLGESSSVPKWTLSEVRTGLTSSEARWRFLVDSVGEDMGMSAYIYEHASSLEQSPEFDDDELTELCNIRWGRKQADPDASVTLCAHSGDLGMLTEEARKKLGITSAARIMEEHLTEIRQRIASMDGDGGSFAYYVYGHTHKEHGLCSPFGSSKPWRPQAINDGAWQRTASAPVFCAIARARNLADSEAMAVIAPEDLPPCYPFVMAVAGSEPKLRYWVQSPGGKGHVRLTCTELPPIPAQCEAVVPDPCPSAD